MYTRYTKYVPRDLEDTLETSPCTKAPRTKNLLLSDCDSAPPGCDACVARDRL